MFLKFIATSFFCLIAVSNSVAQIEFPKLEPIDELHKEGKYITVCISGDSLISTHSLSWQEEYELLSILSDSYHKLKMFDRSIDYLLKKIDIAFSHNVSAEDIYYLYDFLGSLYKELNDDNNSLKYRKKAFELVANESSVSDATKMHAHNNLGYAYETVGNDHVALTHYRSGMDIYSRIHNKTSRDSTLYHILSGNLGVSLLRKNDSNGIDYLDQAINYIDKTNLLSLRLNYRIQLARYYINSREYDIAESRLSEAEKLVHPNDLQTLHKIYLEKIIVYGLTKNHDKLKQSKSNIENTRLKILAKNNEKELSYSNSELQLIKSKQEKQLLNSQIELQEKERQSQSIIVWFSIVLGFISILFIYLMYRKGKRSSQQEIKLHELKESLLETKLEKESSELKNLTEWFELQKIEMSKMLKSNQLKENELKNVIKELKSLKYKDSNNFGSVLSDIQFKLNSIQESSESKFNETSSNEDEKLVISKLNKKLLENHPELTKNDLHICYLLYSGVSNQDIGNIKNISINSVRMSKYRIKKKIGIAKSDDLETYLNEIIKT